MTKPKLQPVISTSSLLGVSISQQQWPSFHRLLPKHSRAGNVNRREETLFSLSFCLLLFSHSTVRDWWDRCGQEQTGTDRLAVNPWYNQLEDREKEITKGWGFMSGVSWLFNRAIPKSQHLLMNYFNENIKTSESCSAWRGFMTWL